MYITRHMEKTVMELNGQYPVLLLTGPRQVGKTTMLEHLTEVEGKRRRKVSLDDLTVRELAKTDPKMFFQLYQPPLMIDEVQYAPELFPYIKIMVDERHQPGDFWLTGSQLFKMMEGVQESLAGRVALLHLPPLSQSEIVGWPAEEPFLYYYRDKDAREIDLILERDGKLFPIEIKKMASPPRKLTKVFDLIDKSPLNRGTGAVLCMADQLGAFDQDNLIVPVSLI